MARYYDRRAGIFVNQGRAVLPGFGGLIYVSRKYILLKKGKLPLDFSVEVAEAEGRTEVRVGYGGPAYDPFGDAEELSLRIVAGLFSQREHRFDGEKNLLLLTF